MVVSWTGGSNERLRFRKVGRSCLFGFFVSQPHHFLRGEFSKFWGIFCRWGRIFFWLSNQCGLKIWQICQILERGRRFKDMDFLTIWPFGCFCHCRCIVVCRKLRVKFFLVSLFARWNDSIFFSQHMSSCVKCMSILYHAQCMYLYYYIYRWTLRCTDLHSVL